MGAMRRTLLCPLGCPLYRDRRNICLATLLGGGSHGTPVHIMRVSTARSQADWDARHEGAHYCQYQLDAFATDTKKQLAITTLVYV